MNPSPITESLTSMNPLKITSFNCIILIIEFYFLNLNPYNSSFPNCPDRLSTANLLLFRLLVNNFIEINTFYEIIS